MAGGMLAEAEIALEIAVSIGGNSVVPRSFLPSSL